MKNLTNNVSRYEIYLKHLREYIAVNLFERVYYPRAIIEF